MSYIIKVVSLSGDKVEYFRANNLTEAKLFQTSSVNYVYIFTAHEFINKLPRVPVNRKQQSDFDVIL